MITEFTGALGALVLIPSEKKMCSLRAYCDFYQCQSKNILNSESFQDLYVCFEKIMCAYKKDWRAQTSVLFNDSLLCEISI